jgi:hypothetical protein
MDYLSFLRPSRGQPTPRVLVVGPREAEEADEADEAKATPPPPFNLSFSFLLFIAFSWLYHTTLRELID